MRRLLVTIAVLGLLLSGCTHIPDIGRNGPFHAGRMVGHVQKA